jgi:hypothetical protein
LEADHEAIYIAHASVGYCRIQVQNHLFIISREIIKRLDKSPGGTAVVTYKDAILRIIFVKMLKHPETERDIGLTGQVYKHDGRLLGNTATIITIRV